MRVIRRGLVASGLRGATIVSKFVLVLYIGHYLTIADMGVYGLLNAAILFSVNFIGFGYWNINSRNMLVADDEHVARLMRDQIVFHIICYMLTLPLLAWVSQLHLIESRFLVFFLVLTVTEHLGLEMYCIQIVMHRQIAANGIMFLRNGAWIYPVTLVGVFFPETRSLERIWWTWIGFDLLSLIMSSLLFRHLPWRQAVRSPIMWKNMRQTILVAFPYWGIAISAKAMEYADRYVLKAYTNDAVVGVYMFYFSLSSIVQTLIFTATTGMEYPKVVQAYLHRRIGRFVVLFRRMARNVVLACLGAIPISVAGLFCALLLVQKDAYWGYYGLFAVLLLASLTAAVAQIPYYFLYAQNRGYYILGCNVAGFAAAIVTLPFLVQTYGILGAALGMLTGNLVSLLAQVAAARSLVGSGQYDLP